MPERIRMLFGMVVGFGDRSTETGNLGANMERPIVTNGGLFTIGNSHCAAARLLLGEFLELQARRRARRAGLSLACGVVSNAALLPRNCEQTC